ncbi:NUDIX domain-containing protein [Nitrosomonas communis]|uniref:NUDIX domain-containing protein n=1 Tax=Nitrosomonas communis TaxID=44574 RepID=UPI0026F01706|nr:NUDIX domain-containing protein [Nitrosomonas communis]MCO6427229.1 NUDIX domain-containing protein [Nitrosomonas communis]
MTDEDVEIIQKELCFHGFFRMERYTLRHRLFNGDWSRPLIRELLERGHAAAILPYDPVRDQVVLIEQFRVGAMSVATGAWLLEIVAGIIEADEAAEDVVRREAVEEAGCDILDIVPLYDYLVSPGGTTERIALFCGKVNSAQMGGIYGKMEEGEDIQVHVMSLGDALTLLGSGKIISASAIIALQWLALNREYLHKIWLSG